MAKFFVDAIPDVGENAILVGENLTHGKVLRLKTGEKVTICDGCGHEALCSVEEIVKDAISMKVEEVRASRAEAAVKVSVYMAFSKADKLEHVIQKATELGATEIVAFPSARCVSRPDEKGKEKKLERWQKIAVSAAEQSGRGAVPRVRVCLSFQQAIEEAARADMPILFYENEQALTLKMALKSKPFHSVSILTGPEGGLEPGEVEQARNAGMQICTLGRRILRCETAPLCALSAIMYEAGEF